MAYVAKISVDLIDFPPEGFAARPVPKPTDKNYGEYLSTKEDIKNKGILNIPTVRPDGDNHYVVADGTGRILAVKELLKEGHAGTIARYGEGVTVQVEEMSDVDALGAQISCNYNSRKQPLASLAKAIYKVMTAKNMTLDELAKFVGFPMDKLLNTLRINKLSNEFKAAIDAGQITAANAYAITKIDPAIVEEDQSEWLEKAKVQTAQEFAAGVADYLNELKKAKKGETVKKAPEFTPTQKLLKKEDLAILLDRTRFDFEGDPENPYLKGRMDVMLEIFQMDEKSVEKQKADWDAAQKAAADKKEQRRKEREAQKEKDSIEWLKEHKPDALSESILG